MLQLENLLNHNFQEMHDNYDSINNRLQQIEKSNKYLQEEMGTMVTTLPQLSDNIKAQQAHLIQTLNENTEFCKVTTGRINQIQLHQKSTDIRFEQLEEIVSSLLNKSTPSSSSRTRKKSRQQIQELNFSN
jgi:predicted nuclease with TOPRIM domain